MENEDIRNLRQAVRRLQHNLSWQWKSDAACCGVTMGQCHALLEVADKEEVSLADMAEALGLDRSTLSRTVDGLVEDGLLERRAKPGDRRYVSITLTKQGKNVCAELNTVYNQYLKDVMTLIPPDKRKQVIESLILLTHAVGKSTAASCCLKEASK